MKGLGCLSAALALAPPAVFAAACDAPRFEETTFKRIEPEAGAVSLSVAAMLRLGVPAGVEGIVFSGDANVFGYSNNKRLTVGLETSASIAPHAHRAKPEPFFRGVFEGKTSVGCKYLATFNLEREEYRVRSKVGSMDVFAYGKGSAHEAFVLNPGRPDVVVRLRLSGSDRQAFESLLSTIQPQ
jgi:hypothetical protein